MEIEIANRHQIRPRIIEDLDPTQITGPKAAIKNGGSWQLTSGQQTIINTPDEDIIWVENIHELVIALEQLNPGGPDWTLVSVNGDNAHVSDHPIYSGTDEERAFELAQEHKLVYVSRELTNSLKGKYAKNLEYYHDFVIRRHWVISRERIEYRDKAVPTFNRLGSFSEAGLAKAIKKGEFYWPLFYQLMDQFLMPSLRDAYDSHLKILVAYEVNMQPPSIRMGGIRSTNVNKKQVYKSPQRISKAIVDISGKPVWRKRHGWRQMVKEIIPLLPSMQKHRDRRALVAWIQYEADAIGLKSFQESK